MVIRPIRENLDSPIAPPVCSLAAAIQPQLGSPLGRANQAHQ
jgi:hypothetical protein